MPSCDQTGVPIHFHSSTTPGSASLMSLRILARVFPRQSPSSAILFELSSDASTPRLASGFFMFSSAQRRAIGPGDERAPHAALDRAHAVREVGREHDGRPELASLVADRGVE